MKTLQAIHGFLCVTRLRRYGLAVLLTGLATLVSRITCAHPCLGSFAILTATAVTSAWFGGLGPGLLSTLLIPVSFLLNIASPDGLERPLALVLSTPLAAGLAFTGAHSRIELLRRWHEQAMQPLRLWEEDQEFSRIVGTIQHTLVDRARCYMLYQVARQTAHLAGEVAEVGVYKGGTAKLLARSLPHKSVHLFDTFAGMPATNPGLDKHVGGDFSDTSLDEVRQHLKDCGNVRFYQGVFPSTAGPVEATRFSLVHVDADIYDSVRACCEFFYPRLERDAVLIFDDYGFPTCPGARKAVDDFFRDKVEIPLYLPTGQCWIVRK